MLKLYFRKPIGGGKLIEDMPANWSITSIDCHPLKCGQVPPAETLVDNLHRDMVGEDGKAAPKETLRRYDLGRAIGDACRAAWS